MGLLAFVAVSRLDAPVVWVGVIGSSGYFGYLWNVFFSALTAKLSLRKSIVVVMFVSAVLLCTGAFQRSYLPYCLIVVAFHVALGLYEVQYNTLVYHLYDAETRSKRLSQRQLAIASAWTLFSALFGRISSGTIGHMPAFLLAAMMMTAGGLVFRTIRTTVDHRMQSFHPWEMVRTIFRDQRFVRVAVILTVYGWVGAGSSTLFVMLYKQFGFDEWQVGILRAMMTAGTIAATLLITPRIKFQGGISNFRLCFGGTLGAILVFVLIGMVNLGDMTFSACVVANLVFGIANAGFMLAMQTTAINLAPSDKVTVYVNGLMVVQGARGMLAPLLVAAVLDAWGMAVSLLISGIVALFCGVVVWIPGIDGRLRIAGGQNSD